MIMKVGLFMLLFSCAVAMDMYNENRAYGMDQNEDVNYNQNENYDYENHGLYRPEIRDEQLQNPMQYQLFNSLQNGYERRLVHNRPKFSMVENPLAGNGHVPYPELKNLKRSIVKRRASGGVLALADNNGNQKPAKPKQEPRKGRNSQKGQISWCYMKLCVYPRPVIQK